MVERYGGVPPFPETQKARVITGHMAEREKERFFHKLGFTRIHPHPSRVRDEWSQQIKIGLKNTAIPGSGGSCDESSLNSSPTLKGGDSNRLMLAHKALGRSFHAACSVLRAALGYRGRADSHSLITLTCSTVSPSQPVGPEFLQSERRSKQVWEERFRFIALSTSADAFVQEPCRRYEIRRS